jgi:hypothetical protein
VTLPSPSTALVHILAWLEDVILEEPDLQQDLVAIAEQARTESEEAWQLDTEALYEAIDFDPERLAVDDSPQSLARWVGIFDAWHRFANPGLATFSEAPPPAAAQRAEARLDRTGRYNEDEMPRHGVLIPATCPGVTGAAGAPRTPLIDQYQAYLAVHADGRKHQLYDHLSDALTPLGANSLLRNTTWLPQTIACGHPDGRQAPLRQIRAGYVQIGALNKSAPLPIDAGLRIAVAPLAETQACIEVIVTDMGTRYLVAPVFPIERAKAAIRDAYAGGVQVLLLPEMTIDSRWLSDLAEAARQARRSNRRSALRYIILGATSPPDDGRVGENFVAVIDGDGRLVESGNPGGAVRQDKICRWNLGRGEQRRFGFDRNRGAKPPLAPLVVESIDEASTVFVFDMIGFGRLVCLICASLDHNQPSDWLVQHTRPDWIYAPVMDSSTCWTGSQASPLEKWTVKRAVRAACLSRGKVVVSNSMTLQAFENAELAYADDPDKKPKAAAPHRPNLRPGIALMIDGSVETLPHQIVRAAIPDKADDTAPILASADWNDGWSELPASIV